jgi:hypothetical protein
VPICKSLFLFSFHLLPLILLFRRSLLQLVALPLQIEHLQFQLRHLANHGLGHDGHLPVVPKRNLCDDAFSVHLVLEGGGVHLKMVPPPRRVKYVQLGLAAALARGSIVDDALCHVADVVLAVDCANGRIVVLGGGLAEM